MKACELGRLFQQTFNNKSKPIWCVSSDAYVLKLSIQNVSYSGVCAGGLISMSFFSCAYFLRSNFATNAAKFGSGLPSSYLVSTPNSVRTPYFIASLS